jgi:4-hydroxy-tetrahydrodipicolinate reductase
MRLAIMGAGGRMGRALIRAVTESKSCTVTGAVEREGSPFLGQDAGTVAGLDPLGVPIVSDPLELFTRIEGVLDFTSPDASVKYAGLAAQGRVVHVIGTTGFTPAQEAKLEAAARHATIVRSGNMSLGVTLLSVLTEKVAKALNADFDIEIVEMHHRHKVDAPSGTALLLGQAAATGRGVSLEKVAVRGRDGVTGERPEGAIGFASLRGGSVVGDHTVIFAGGGERIELTHRAEDRQLFARGAVRAATWASGREPGLYSMRDVLSLS